MSISGLLSIAGRVLCVCVSLCFSQCDIPNRDTPHSSSMCMDFPSNKASTLWGAPILGNPQIAKGQVRAEQLMPRLVDVKKTGAIV